jgi:hypothetical protein
MGLGIKHWVKISETKTGLGSEILHGTRAELKKSRNILASQKIGTTVTSPDIIFHFSFSAKRGQWLQV